MQIACLAISEHMHKTDLPMPNQSASKLFMRKLYPSRRDQLAGICIPYMRAQSASKFIA